VTKLAHDLNVRRSVAAIVFFETILAIPLLLGLFAALEHPHLWWTLIIPLGMMIGALTHHMSFVLRVSDGVLVYREPFHGVTEIPLGDIEKAYVAGWFTRGEKLRLPKQLVIIPKPTSFASEFDINAAVFDNGDISRLLQLLPG
jgi:hypothetical protein